MLLPLSYENFSNSKQSLEVRMKNRGKVEPKIEDTTPTNPFPYPSR